MRGDRQRTPVPKSEVERKSTGSGPVKRYFLSPEELLKYRNEEEIEMSKYPHITKELLEKEIALGKSNRQIEEEQGIPTGALSYWMGKLGVKRPKRKPGHKSSKAQVQAAETPKAPKVEIPKVEKPEVLETIKKDEVVVPAEEITNYIQATIERDQQLVELAKPKKIGRSIQIQVTDSSNGIHGELQALAGYVQTPSARNRSYKLELSLVEVLSD